MSMPRNSRDAPKFVVTAVFNGSGERSDQERYTYVFDREVTLEAVFKKIYPEEGSMAGILFRPPVKIEIAPDLTTIPPEKDVFAEWAAEKKDDVPL